MNFWEFNPLWDVVPHLETFAGAGLFNGPNGDSQRWGMAFCMNGGSVSLVLKGIAMPAMAQGFNIPATGEVWTINYRDLGGFVQQEFDFLVAVLPLSLYWAEIIWKG